ncbi:MAG: TonB-dependent receptor [Spirosomataceae bacterium]
MKAVLLTLFCAISPYIFAQEKITISGYIRDKADGEGLIGASVFLKEANVGIQTNVYGFYSLSVPAGNYSLSITYVGYETIELKVNLTKNVQKNIELVSASNQLNEVVISAEAPNENVKSLEMSVSKVSMSTIRKMPALLGEVDVIRSIQFLPGVSTVGEGSSGFNVRGGGIDQNLILLDEAPVYNSSHLFGFFSVFNPDAVKDVKLIKGGIPANYGGRISSILDVRMKEGNAKKGEFTGGIGTIFTRLAYERPFVKDKGSFIVALRRSYIDVLAKPFLNADLRSSQFYFYDFTAKANYRINEKNNVYISGYFGRDVFGSGFGFDWGNGTTTLRWNHVFSPKLFSNSTVFYSNYDYALNSNLDGSDTQDSFQWKSNIINYSLKQDFTYYLNAKNTMNFGGQVIYYDFSPGEAIAISSGEERKIGLENKYAVETAFYVDNQQNIGSKLSFQYGLRYSVYQYLGPGRKFTITPNTVNPADRGTIVNSEEVGKGETIQMYGNWEPRFAMNYSVSANSSFKLSFNRLAQYVHLLSNTAASSPLDVWTPSTNNIKPQISNQLALGYFFNFNENKLEASVETYYKSLENQIDYVRNADLLLNPFVEADLLNGIGRAYGAEFYLKKKTGKLNGWISYTLSKTERKVNGLNNGDWFVSRIDRPHNLSVIAIYEPSARVSFSSNFTFTSGTPATFPSNKFLFQGYALPHNFTDNRNNYRIPDTHRLDISATLKNKYALFKKGESEWVLSVYNVYNRKNPFSVYVRQNPENPSQTQAVRLAVFGSILPAITYNFKF